MAHKITQILWHTKKYIFCQSDKRTDIILTHSHWTAIVGLAVVFSLFDNLREKRSVLLTEIVRHDLEILAAHLLEITDLE